MKIMAITALSVSFMQDNKTTILVCLAAFAFAYKVISQQLNRNRLPPGPIGLPMIGSLFTLIVSSVYNEHPHDLISRLAVKYGKIFCLGLGGGSRLVYLNNFELVAEAFKNPKLSYRPPSNAVQRLTGVSGLLSASGEAWHQQRKFSLAVFRSFGVGKENFEDQIKTEAQSISDEFAAFEGNQFDPKYHLMNATSNVICSVIFGRRFNYNDEEFKRMLTILDKRMQLIGSGGLIGVVPVLRYLSFKSAQKNDDIVKETIENFQQIVNQHKSRMETFEECNDLIDLYLKEIVANQQESIPSSVVDERHLVALIDALFLAGTETSSNTLGWCLLYMTAYPDVQRQIQDEIHSVCGERLPSYDDQQNMPYTEAVILELQRLHTIAPLGVPHYAGEDTTLQGYTIPQGSFVIANLWGVLHDPDIWPDPYVFKPERFLNANGETNVPMQWIPFSTGRRVCLGEKLGKMEIFIFLTHLLARFFFKNPDGQTLSFESRSGATLGPLPFKLCAIPRV